MNRFDTHIVWCGTALELQVIYNIDDDLELEIERADVVGVYLRGDNVKKGDYTPLGIDIPLWGNEMPSWLYDELLIECEQHLLNTEGDDDEA